MANNFYFLCEKKYSFGRRGLQKKNNANVVRAPDLISNFFDNTKTHPNNNKSWSAGLFWTNL